MKVAIMQPYFFPYIGYFQLIKSVDVYINLDHVSFMKRSYMTRNELKNNTSINLNVTKGSQNKSCIETFVNVDENYINKFKKTLYHLYGKTPYYDEIINEIINPCFTVGNVNISTFNLKILKKICSFLEINTKIVDSSFGMTERKKGDGLIDIIKKFNSTEYINAIGGKKLYNKEYFKDNGINLYFIEMLDVNFENPYSSILDLLFTYEKKHIIQNLDKYKLT
jgi:hypothetical protein